MDSASDQAGVMMPRLTDRPGRAIALDALSFLALAAAVALGISAVLSAMVLLLAGRAEATSGAAPAASAPLRTHATGNTASVCAANDFANFLLPVVDQHTSRPPMPVERCHFSMKYSDSPEVNSTSTLLQVRWMNPGRARRA
jgi:hypothetical protein